MALTPSIRIDKAFDYRGAPKVFSNRYHFSGGTPADTAAWNTLKDAIILAEKAIYQGVGGGVEPNVDLIGAVGYEAGSDVPVYMDTFTVEPTGLFASADLTPGATAMLVRYATTARSAKNHPVYLYNYYHSALRTLGGDADALNPAQKVALEAYADAWLAGFSDGSHTLVRAGPNGATAVSRQVKAELTHRDFPR